MKRPKHWEDKYWDGLRFRHWIFVEDIDKYCNYIENKLSKKVKQSIK